MDAICPQLLMAKDKGKSIRGRTLLRPGNVTVHLVLVSVQVCFSGWHVLAKVALNDGVNAMALAMAREALATVLMFAIARRVDGVVNLDPSHMVRIMLMGLASFGNIVGSIIALKYMSPMAFGVMQPSIPMFAMVLSYLCGVETMSRLKCVGVLVAIAGAIFVEMFSASHSTSTSTEEVGVGVGPSDASAWIGSVVLLVQCASMGSLVVIQKPCLAVYPSATLTAWYYAVGSCFTLLMCGFFGVRAEDFLLTGKVEPWLALLYSVLLGTVYTYNAYSWAVNIVSPTTATVYVTLQPFATVLLSWVFLHTIVSGQDVLGGVAIVAGLWITLYAKGLEYKGTASLLRAKQNRELSRAFRAPARHQRFRRTAGASSGAAELSNSDTDGAVGGLGFDSDHDPLLGRGSYDPLEAEDKAGSLRRFMALV